MSSRLTRRTALQFGIVTSLASARGWAQERGRIYHLGSLFSAPRDAPHQIVLLDGLRRSGFIEGQNLSVDWSGYGLRAEQFDEHAAELVRARVDVILAGGDAAVRAAQRATTEVDPENETVG